MTAADRLGAAYRRLASDSSVRRVQSLDEARELRLGSSSADLNARFLARVEILEAKVDALSAPTAEVK